MKLRRPQFVLAVVALAVTAGVVVPPAGAAPGAYVAVGDSYTAGPGVLFQTLDHRKRPPLIRYSAR